MPYMTGEHETRQTSARKLTYDDFLRLPGFEDDGRRHELIDGEHHVTPSPSERHQSVVVELTRVLGNYITATGIGRVYVGPFDVILSPHDVVEPDVLFVLADELKTVTQRGVFGAPALVVEVLSPGARRRDKTVKRKLYGLAGVQEYWIVDPDARTVTVYRSTPARVLEVVEDLGPTGHETLTSPLLPGFSVVVADLFASSVG